MANGFTRKLLSLIVFVAGVAAAQSAQTRKGIQESKPTLKETLGWIRDSLNDGYGDVKKQTDKGTEIHELRLVDFFGCRVHFVSAETVAGKETFHEDELFNIGVMDPTKVRFARGIASNPGWFTAVTHSLINKIATKNTYGTPSLPETEGRSNMLTDDFYGLYRDDSVVPILSATCDENEFGGVEQVFGMRDLFSSEGLEALQWIGIDIT